MHLWVLLVTLSAACRQIVGFDPLEKSQPAIDFGPFRRYLSGTECESCLEKKCSEPQRACDADDFCSGWFADARASDLPVIANPDLQRRLDDAYWESDHARPSGAQAQLDLRDCSTKRCGEECRLGRDFSCVGKFEWPESFPEQTSVRLWLTDLDGPELPDLHVKACPADTDCASALGEGVTDANGFTVVTVDTSSASLTPSPEFYGFMRVEGTEAYATTDFLRSAPWRDQYYGEYFLATRAAFQSIAGRAGLTLDARRGIAAVQVSDCTGAGVTGVSLDFWSRANGSFVPCEDCEL